MLQLHITTEYAAAASCHLSLLWATDDRAEGAWTKCRMHSSDRRQWQCDISFAPDTTAKWLQFRYVLEDIDGLVLREEWHRVPHIVRIPSTDATQLHLVSRWQDTPDDDFRYTQLFASSPSAADAEPYPSASSPISPDDAPSPLTLLVRAPHLNGGERLCLTGAGEALGAWNTARALPLRQVDTGRWMLSLPPSASGEAPMEAKFVAVSKDNVRWETGDNRLIPLPERTDDGLYVAELPDVQLPFDRPRWTGTLVPVFALRSKGSAGVGDFGDLDAMIRWVAHTHQRVLQLLPVNDTTTDGSWHDSYPYSSVSVFALHPLYIDLRQLPPLDLSDRQRRTLRQRIRRLNHLQQVDYEQVMSLKDTWMRLSFQQQWARVSQSKAFRQWFREAQSWLVPYAVFRQTALDCGTADFDSWQQHRQWTEQLRRKYTVIHRRQPLPHYYFFYQQWVLHEQLTRVCRTARSLGVHLKGDIGIGVNPQACDVWQHPDLFHRTMQAGAPPDFFSREGQNWRFPTYNWQAMQREGYRWWAQRLQHMQRYFDVFRIDHILGFFRIWEIPLPHRDGRRGHFAPALPLTPEQCRHHPDLFLPDPYSQKGLHPRIDARDTETYRALPQHEREDFDRLYDDFFYHRHNQLWYDEAMKKLSVLLNRTAMMPCAEDLGMIADSVPWLMRQLRILSLEMEIMPKGHQHGEFADAGGFPYLSVCMPSTHDTSPLRLWWEEDRARTQRYYRHQLHHDGEAPATLQPDIAAEILRRYLHAPSMLCVIPLQDWFALQPHLYRNNPQDERVNDPANPRHYWRYRMHVDIKQLLADTKLTQQIRHLVHESRR